MTDKKDKTVEGRGNQKGQPEQTERNAENKTSSTDQSMDKHWYVYPKVASLHTRVFLGKFVSNWPHRPV